MSERPFRVAYGHLGKCRKSQTDVGLSDKCNNLLNALYINKVGFSTLNEQSRLPLKTSLVTVHACEPSYNCFCR